MAVNIPRLVCLHVIENIFPTSNKSMFGRRGQKFSGHSISFPEGARLLSTINHPLSTWLRLRPSPVVIHSLTSPLLGHAFPMEICARRLLHLTRGSRHVVPFRQSRPTGGGTNQT